MNFCLASNWSATRFVIEAIGFTFAHQNGVSDSLRAWRAFIAQAR